MSARTLLFGDRLPEGSGVVQPDSAEREQDPTLHVEFYANDQDTHQEDVGDSGRDIVVTVETSNGTASGPLEAARLILHEASSQMASFKDEETAVSKSLEQQTAHAVGIRNSRSSKAKTRRDHDIRQSEQQKDAEVAKSQERVNRAVEAARLAIIEVFAQMRRHEHALMDTNIQYDKSVEEAYAEAEDAIAEAESDLSAKEQAISEDARARREDIEQQRRQVVEEKRQALAIHTVATANQILRERGPNAETAGITDNMDKAAVVLGFYSSEAVQQLHNMQQWFDRGQNVRVRAYPNSSDSQFAGNSVEYTGSSATIPGLSSSVGIQIRRTTPVSELHEHSLYHVDIVVGVRQSELDREGVYLLKVATFSNLSPGKLFGQGEDLALAYDVNEDYWDSNVVAQLPRQKIGESYRRLSVVECHSSSGGYQPYPIPRLEVGEQIEA